LLGLHDFTGVEVDLMRNTLISRTVAFTEVSIVEADRPGRKKGDGSFPDIEALQEMR
jgi:hypothetical protein